MSPLGLLSKDVPDPRLNTVNHSFLPALTALVRLSLSAYLTVYSFMGGSPPTDSPLSKGTALFY